MKTLEQAVRLRSSIFRAFEAASVATDATERRTWLTFVVVGAGPTGVELAGQIAALTRRSLRRQFRSLDPDDVRIVLVDAGDRVLGPFEQPLREHAYVKLCSLGVEVRLDRAASGIDAQGVDLTPTNEDDKDPQRIDSRTVVWAAGVKPSPLAQQLANATGAETDDGGRIRVDEHCQVPGHPEIFAIGDIANVQDLPGLAEPAMQEGKHVAKVIASRLTGTAATDAFRYRDLGTMATIAPDDAVAQVGPLRLTGWIGKGAWAAVHLAFLVGWGNRLAVMFSWGRAVLRGSRRQQVIL
jgi:NADH dehydrogenase